MKKERKMFLKEIKDIIKEGCRLKYDYDFRREEELICKKEHLCPSCKIILSKLNNLK
jgi:hypothetical protein